MVRGFSTDLPEQWTLSPLKGFQSLSSGHVLVLLFWGWVEERLWFGVWLEVKALSSAHVSASWLAVLVCCL